eukprot:362823-Chlamydomonas_euryale.AAC.3
MRRGTSGTAVSTPKDPALVPAARNGAPPPPPPPLPSSSPSRSSRGDVSLPSESERSDPNSNGCDEMAVPGASSPSSAAAASAAAAAAGRAAAAGVCAWAHSAAVRPLAASAAGPRSALLPPACGGSKWPAAVRPAAADGALGPGGVGAWAPRDMSAPPLSPLGATAMAAVACL